MSRIFKKKDSMMGRIQTGRKTFTAAQGRNCQVTYFTVSGTTPGPVMTVIAGQHGMEHSGPNLLPEFIDEMAGREFAGTLHICPCANPLALEMDYEFYPENEDLTKIKDYYYSRFRHNYCPWNLGRDNGRTFYNMNRLWNKPDAPGIAGRIAQWLWEEICGKADIVIDMHCLQAEKPLIYIHHEKNNIIARYAGIEVVYIIDRNPDSYNNGNLSWQASQQGEHRHAICIEFSQQHGLKESEYELGKQAVRNIMTGANMLEGEVINPRPVWEIPENSKSTDMTVKNTGHIRYFTDLYEHVEKGDRIFEVRDMQTLEILEEGIAPHAGIVCNKSYLPVMRDGVIACRIVDARLLAEAGKTVEKLRPDYFK